MKIFLFLLIFVKVCSCLEDGKKSSNYWREFVYDDDLRYDRHHQDLIERPCSVHDVNCIRRFFAHNSRCTPAHGLAPDTQRIKTLPTFIPHANVTFTLNLLELKGWNNYKIKEFYINKQTDTLVLEVEFGNLVSYSPVTVITYHRKGKEPIQIADFAFIEYRDLSLTLTVDHIKDIKLSRAHVYTYISDAAPRKGLGPNFTQSRDPYVRRVSKQLLNKIGLSLQEAFITQGPVFMTMFVQNSICDFKIHKIDV